VSLEGRFPTASLSTHTHNRFTALWNLSGTTRVSWYQKKHSPTTLIMVINHPYLLSQSTTTWHHPYSIHVLCSLFPQSLSKFSLVYLLAWHPQHNTPYISSPNHCLLFTIHAHTIATCFAVVPKLYHLILVSLSTLYLELYPSDYSHLYLLKCHLIFLSYGHMYGWAQSATYRSVRGKLCNLPNRPVKGVTMHVSAKSRQLSVCVANCYQYRQILLPGEYTRCHCVQRDMVDWA